MRHDFHPDGPFKQILMYCDTSSSQGATMKYENKLIFLDIALQCGFENMWDKDKQKCIAMNKTIQSKLLSNQKQSGTLSEYALIVMPLIIILSHLKKTNEKIIITHSR